jgi:outer membrane protein assembly factor BamD (BamD/ComL family)
VGFFAPDDLIATLTLGKGHWCLGTEQFPEARAMFEEVLACYPDTEAAAEAIFFGGVTRYKISHDPKALREAYDLLTSKFPQSMWTKQATHYRLINP